MEECHIVECVLWYSSLVTLCTNPTVLLRLPKNVYMYLILKGTLQCLQWKGSRKNGAQKITRLQIDRVRLIRRGGGIRLIVGFQPLMVISPTASWIRWCMQVYAWWFNVDLSCLGRTIYVRQFLGAKPPIQFHHRWTERNHTDHLYWLWAAQ